MASDPIDRFGVKVGVQVTSPTSFVPSADLAIKTPVLCATTAAIALSGLQTIDGVAVLEGSRVLVKDQVDTTTNGIYNASSGAWLRSADLDGNDDFAASQIIFIHLGTVNNSTLYQLVATDPVIINTSSLTYTRVSFPPLGNLNTTSPVLINGGTTAPLNVAPTISLLANGITYALFQKVAASSLVGNPTGVLATSQGITLGATLAFSASSLQTGAGSGDVSWSANSFVTTIGANKVTRAMMAQGIARSVIGVTGNATANVADIQGTANQVLVINSAGTALAFGQVNLAAAAAVTGTLPSSLGGTDNAAYAVGDLLQASAVTPTLARLAAVATGNALISGGVGVVSSWGKIGLTTHITGTLGAGNGGTGATSLGVEFTVAANVFHVANNGITYALFQQVAASSLVGNATAGLATATGITLGATLAFSGSSLQTAAFTGDATASANSHVLTLATVNSNVGSFGSSTAIPVITANGKGLITALSTAVVIAPAGTLTGTTLAANVVTSSLTSVGTLTGGATGAGFTIALTTSTVTGTLPASAFPALTGDVTTVSGALATTIAANAVTYAKFQQVAASSLVGNATGSLANATGITLGATLAFSGSALQTAAHTGDVTTSANSFVTTVAKIAGTTVSGTTGSGNVVFATSPTIAGGTHTALTSLGIRSTGAAFDLTIASSEVFTAGRTLTISMGDTARTLTFTANATIGGTHSGTSSGTNTGDQTITLTSDVTGSGTGSFATTIAANAVTYAKFQQVAASSLVGNATGVLANATGITLGATLAFSGSALQTTAMTGDVTASANSFATTIAANAVTNAKMATMATLTIKSNITGGSATPSDNTLTAILDTLTTTQGSILYRGASNWATLGPGTSTFFLQTQGAGANPVWAAGGGGGGSSVTDGWVEHGHFGGV